MEKIKCTECEHENSLMLSYCSNCGAQLPLTQPGGLEMNNELFSEKQRNGFVSFWFWLCIIANGIQVVMYLFSLFSDRGVMYAYEPMSDRLITLVLTGVMIVGYIGLLKWKKSGFYIIVGAQILNWFMSISIGLLKGWYIIVPFISIAILFAILQIKKNGKSCWSQLS